MKSAQADPPNAWSCDQMQGHLYVRPMDPDAVTAMLATAGEDDGVDADTDVDEERRRAA